ncbi:ALP1-like protein [Tanacetum coccineum]
MDPNQSDDEHNNFSEVDDETNMWFMMQAYEYNQRLEEEQNKPCLTRNSIHRDREDAERRLMADYFDDYYLTCVFLKASANNDINVLDNSPLFDDLLDDIAHVAPFVVNGVGFKKGYYLADIIYPQWATFVKSFTVANDEKHSFFKRQQESARKDVERAFGVLQ